MTQNKVVDEKKVKKDTEKEISVKCFLERKDRIGFELFLPKYRKVIAESSGIYVLYKGNKLVYIGVAQKLLKKTVWHLTDKNRNVWDKISLYVIDKHLFIKYLETINFRIAETQEVFTKSKYEQAGLISPEPSFTGLGNQLELVDLDADGGKQLANLDIEPKGYFKLSDENVWLTISRVIKNSFLTDSQKDDLLVTTKLSLVVGENFELIKALKTNKSEKLESIVTWGRKAWLKLIKENNIMIPEGEESLESYVEHIQKRIQFFKRLKK